MGKRIYQPRRNTTIKLRLQHTDPSGEMSPLLDALAEQLEQHKSKLVSCYNRPRLGTNPKYDRHQATAMYVELDYALLSWMIQALAAVNTGRAA